MSTVTKMVSTTEHVLKTTGIPILQLGMNLNNSLSVLHQWEVLTNPVHPVFTCVELNSDPKFYFTTETYENQVLLINHCQILCATDKINDRKTTITHMC
jgi:hypothetical protein